MEGDKRSNRVCVTGAGGFLGSWLVKILLAKGYTVHGTVRDPSDEKNAHLKKLDNASENLQLFKADLLDYDALAAAIAGCDGVFHVASPVPSTKFHDPEVDIITPAVTGTLNVLKACSEAEVKRVVVVSSIAAVVFNPNWPQDKLMDEDCWSDEELCRKIENWYCLCKKLAEQEALAYGAKHGLDVITVCPFLIMGPMLQSTLNDSSLFLISLFKGNGEPVENKDWHFVDVRDVVAALLLVYEKTESSGRYICAPHLMRTRDMVEMLKSMYPDYDYPNNYIEIDQRVELSSEKLEKLGWKCRSLEESVVDTVEYYQNAGLLNKD